eukprot:1681312-Rhodomonas_salina.1
MGDINVEREGLRSGDGFSLESDDTKSEESAERVAGAGDRLESVELEPGARATWKRAFRKIQRGSSGESASDGTARRPSGEGSPIGRSWKEVMTGWSSRKENSDSSFPRSGTKSFKEPPKRETREAGVQSIETGFSALNPVNSLLHDMCAVGDFTYAE